MPHSLRAKLSGLRYKQIISDKDYDRLCKALDNEEVLEKIRAEIDEQIDLHDTPFEVDEGMDASFCDGLSKAKEIIYKYRKEQE